MLLYSRKKVRYRRDGYCWKKRKDGKTTREDHMKLKVQGTEVSVVGGRRIVLFLWRVLACHKFVSGKLSIIFIFKWRLIYSPFPTTTSYSSIQCIYGCYVHSAILPTFHRRCYWLLQVSSRKVILAVLSWMEDNSLNIYSRLVVVVQNPDIVLVHYLNVPYPDDNKMAVIAPSLALWGDKKEWTKEELVSQLKPMCKITTTTNATTHIFT